MTRPKASRRQILRILLAGIYLFAVGVHNYQHTTQEDSEKSCVICLGFSAATPKLFKNEIALHAPKFSCEVIKTTISNIPNAKPDLTGNYASRAPPIALAA
jgi:hypothetical protein